MENTSRSGQKILSKYKVNIKNFKEESSPTEVHFSNLDGETIRCPKVIDIVILAVPRPDIAKTHDAK